MCAMRGLQDMCERMMNYVYMYIYIYIYTYNIYLCVCVCVCLWTHHVYTWMQVGGWV